MIDSCFDVVTGVHQCSWSADTIGRSSQRKSGVDSDGGNCRLAGNGHHAIVNGRSTQGGVTVHFGGLCCPFLLEFGNEFTVKLWVAEGRNIREEEETVEI